MRDQAEALRRRLDKLKNGSDAKTIAIVSGKGGVGKSNFSLNFALALSNQNKKVLLFDMDIGMGNIDILLGQTPRHTIVDMFEQQLSFHDIVEKGPDNLAYIAAGTGLSKIFKLDYERLEIFMVQLESILLEYHYVIFDMGAGVSEESLQFILAAHEIFVITTPETTSITDAYAMMKYIYLQENDIPFYLLVNRSHSPKQAKSTLDRLSNVVKRFLKKEVYKLGDLPDDRTVQKSVNHQTPFLIYDPKSHVSQAMNQIAQRYLSNSNPDTSTTSSYSFISKLRHFFMER